MKRGIFGVILALLSVSLGAQNSAADVEGIVTDGAGAAIPNAKVVFENGSETMTTQSGTDGLVHLTLASGHYVVTVSASGFKTVRIVDFLVQTQSPATLKVALFRPNTIIDPVVTSVLDETITSDVPNQLIEGSAAAESRVRSVCELLAHAKNYSGQTVTLDATLAANEEFSAFTTDACKPRPTELIQPSFSESHYDSNSQISKKLNKILRKKHQARVTVVGVFIDPGHFFGHQSCCRYRLDVLELVSVEQVRVER
jgi:hypothetical protein